jgi:cell division cycle 20-like protein 1 (cofactor of APC complex)
MNKTTPTSIFDFITKDDKRPNLKDTSQLSNQDGVQSESSFSFSSNLFNNQGLKDPMNKNNGNLSMPFTNNFSMKENEKNLDNISHNSTIYKSYKQNSTSTVSNLTNTYNVDNQIKNYSSPFMIRTKNTSSYKIIARKLFSDNKEIKGNKSNEYNEKSKTYLKAKSAKENELLEQMQKEPINISKLYKNNTNENKSNKHKTYTPGSNRVTSEKKSSANRLVASNTGSNLLNKFEMAKVLSDNTQQLNDEEDFQLIESKKILDNILLKSIMNDKMTDSLNKFKESSVLDINNNMLQIFQETDQEENNYFKQDDTISKLSNIKESLILTNNKDSKVLKNISAKAYKILDAPGIIDDYYLNLLDWGNNGIISLGIKERIYLWSNTTTKINQLCNYESGNNVGSLLWSQKTDFLAVGKYDGSLDIWDTEKNMIINSFKDHYNRVNVISWNTNRLFPDLIATGSKDSKIIIRDTRSNEGKLFELKEHTHEVCGLKFSNDGNLLASGGNDNLMMVWDIRKIMTNSNNNSPNQILDNNYIIKSTDHKAAVKALAWSPIQRNVLVSGGGSHDQTIKFWNTSNKKLINSIATGTQVCNLVFSKTSDELISTHGYSQNQIHLWDVEKFTQVKTTATLTGHLSRVLYLALSPEGDTIVTAAGDETLRFWNVFPKQLSSSDILDFGEEMLLR